MGDLQATTTTGTDTILKDEAVDVFKASLRGEILRPGDVGYDDARKVWNGMIDKRPALIVRCAGVADHVRSGLSKRAPVLRQSEFYARGQRCRYGYPD